MYDFKSMSVFVMVVEQGSMQAAAEKLQMTPSAVTQSLQKLEQQLKIKLLNRTTRKLSLTEAGEVFYQHVRQMQKNAENAVKCVEVLRSDPIGWLNISCPSGFMDSKLLDVLKEIIENHLGFSLNISFSDKNVDLIEEQVDIALRVGTGALHDTMIARHIYDVQFAILGQKDYLSKQKLPDSPEGLSTLDWIHFSPLAPSEIELYQQDKKIKVLPNYRIKTNSLLASRCLTMKGFGISLQPLADLDDELHSKELVKLFPEWHLPSSPLYLVTLQRIQSEKVRIACEAITHYFQQLSAR